MSDNPKRTPLMDSILGAMDATVDGTAAVARTPIPPIDVAALRSASAEDTALALLAAGYHPTVLYPPGGGKEGKDPIGAGWGLDRPTEAEVRGKFRYKPSAGVGVCMGPGKAPGGRWLIDCEGDGEEAEESLSQLLGGVEVETTGWTSARGSHRLFVVGDGFLDAIIAAGGVEGKGEGGKATYHLAELPGLEIRIGGRKPNGVVKQTHSACPPTVRTDGRPREWFGTGKVAEMPDAAIAFLEALGERRAIQGEHEPPPQTIPINPQAFTATVPRADPVEHYTRRGVDAELKILAATSEGNRNNQLNKSAGRLGMFVAAGVLSEDEAVAGLLDACRANGTGDTSEARATIRSGLEYGKTKPRDLSHVGAKAKAQGPQQQARRASEPPPPVVVDWKASSDDDLGILPLSIVKPKPTRWLWENRLAEGEMSLLAGEGGLGKSQWLLYIAAMLSVGGDWPDKVGRAPIGRTLILAAEDDPATTILPRLLAMGADISKIDILKAKYRIPRDGKEPLIHHASLQDLEYWGVVFDRRPDTKLLIVDPLPSYLGRGVNDSKNAELRAVLEPFIDCITRPRGVCMLSNSHLNKSTENRSPIHRVNGSVAYANLARSVSFVVRDPDDPAHRIFKQEKCNIAPDNLPAIGFRIEGRTIAGEDGEIQTAIPVFDAETIQADLRELMAGDGGSGTRGPAPTKKVDLAKWLVGFMRDKGPILFAQIIDAAGDAGFLGAEDAKGRYVGRNNLYRARDYVPKLEPPDDGLEIVTSKEDGTLLTATGKHRWLMKSIGGTF